MTTLLSCQTLDILTPAPFSKKLKSPATHFLVEQLNWKIQAGQCWVILGPNGVGKSSLLQVFSGLRGSPPNTLFWKKQPLSSYPARQRARHLGLVLQQCGKGLQNTALEMVLSGNYPAHTGWYWESTADRQKAQDALEDVGLADKADITLAALSGGELRRAEIARLLVQNPTLAMLDEPLNHLDIGQQLSVLQLLQQRFQRTGHALLMVLHDLNLARQLATHCLLLFGDGRWQAGTTQAIADVTTLSELMGYPLVEYDTPYGKRLSVDYPK